MHAAHSDSCPEGFLAFWHTCMHGTEERCTCLSPCGVSARSAFAGDMSACKHLQETCLPASTHIHCVCCAEALALAASNNCASAFASACASNSAIQQCFPGSGASAQAAAGAQSFGGNSAQANAQAQAGAGRKMMAA